MYYKVYLVDAKNKRHFLCESITDKDQEHDGFDRLIKEHEGSHILYAEYNPGGNATGKEITRFRSDFK